MSVKKEGDSKTEISATAAEPNGHNTRSTRAHTTSATTSPEAFATATTNS